MTNYYANGKKGSLDGVPIWRPKWYGELGNDAEFREATKPRTAFKAAYYAGGHRLTIGGVPTRLAGYVADWAPWMKRALGKGKDPFGLLTKEPSKWAAYSAPKPPDLFTRADVKSGQLEIAA